MWSGQIPESEQRAERAGLQQMFCCLAGGTARALLCVASVETEV